MLNTTGRVWKYGDDINTDVLFPGKYTYTVSAPEDLARHALEDLDPAFADGVRPGDVVVGGRNFGCGSSREQAVTCLLHAGVQVLIARSFARIFYRNAINNGLLGIVCDEAVSGLRMGDTLLVDRDSRILRCGDRCWRFPPLSPSMQRILDAGGLIEAVRQQLEAAEGLI